MQHQLPTLPGGVPGVVYTIVGVVAATVVISELSRYRKLDAIPTFGSSGWLGSWRAARRYQSEAHLIVWEGYKKMSEPERYKTLSFKIAETWRWLVIVSSRQHIKELRKAPDDKISFHDAMNDILKLEHTLGREIMRNPYHEEVIRGTLTRNLGHLYPEIRNEISVAFDENLDLVDNEWKAIPVMSTLQNVVCRVSNRLFIGLPLCRNPDWIDLNIQYTLDVFKAGNRIRRFANFLAPLIVRYTTNLPANKERAMKHLAPIIKERLKLLEEHGNDWDERPNDMLSWLLDEAPEGIERSIRVLTDRMLMVNFAAIHTSSNSFAHALNSLAENPQYIQPLREEVEAIVEKEGWSKDSMGKMRKIDSFMKESQRMAGVGALGLMRLAKKDFTFSDGTFIPKGTFVAVPTQPLHLDDEIYENAHVFNPFRFSDMRDEEDEGTKHNNFVSTSPGYLPFGHGKNACPGRFFAADELKTMLAHIIVTYDVKLEDNKARPEGVQDGAALLADPSSKVMFRKRAH